MEQLVKFLTIAEKHIKDQAEYLNDLDQKIGDGDHGTNMVRGMTALLSKKDDFVAKPLSQILNDSAMVLVSQVAGSSGPLLGTALLKAGAYLKGKDQFTMEDYAQAFRLGVEGIKARGKSTIDEKTMLDVLIPAAEIFEAGVAQGKDLKTIAQEMEQKAQERVDYTATIIATKGRASYLGERSLGHIDPGAYSSMILLKAFRESLA